MQNAQIAIRADASAAIGSGHVMRCLALAGELRLYGARVVFICRDEPGNLFKLIEQNGFAVWRLPAANPLPQAWQEDAEATRSLLAGNTCDWLIVDHYLLDSRWEGALRKCAHKILAVDDLADRPHDCDILLDQNYFSHAAKRYDGLLPAGCIGLFGPRHALLRPEFQAARKHMRGRDGKIGRVLVFFGGSDPTNETAKVLAAWQALARTDIGVDVVVGAANPKRHQIEELCRLMPSVSYHCQVRNMAELMLGADLAIGAGGSASWERCSVGLPSMVIAIADNQIDVAQALGEAGIVDYLGRSAEVRVDRLAMALERVLDSQEHVRGLAERSLQLVDACGVQRVLGAMREMQEPQLAQALVLRYSLPEDSRLHFEWRNAPQVRAWSFNSDEIGWEAHSAWFNAALRNPARHLLIGEIGDAPAGVLRYDVENDEALVSIFLVPGASGKGLGTRLLKAGSIWVKRQLPQVKRIRARILPTNLASLRAFEKAGYVPIDGDFLHYL